MYTNLSKDDSDICGESDYGTAHDDSGILVDDVFKNSDQVMKMLFSCIVAINYNSVQACVYL